MLQGIHWLPSEGQKWVFPITEYCMIDWEHYRAEWISLCHQYQLYVITTSKHQTAPILAALKAAGSWGSGLVVKTHADFEAAYKVCLQQAVLPASACLPPGLHTFSWSEEPACLSFASWGFLALVRSRGIRGSGTHCNRRLEGTFTFRSVDPIPMVFLEACKRSWGLR